MYLPFAYRQSFSFVVNPLSTTFSLGLVIATFVLLPTEERVGKVKHLQMVCGLNRVVYWLFTFFWDLLWYLAFIFLMLTLYLIFGETNYIEIEEMPLFVIILLSYGLAVIPWIYMWSFLFTSPTTAYVILFCLNFFSGFTFITADIIHVVLGDVYTPLLHYSLVWLPLPAYALIRSMMYLSLERVLFAKPVTEQYWDLLPFIVSLLVQCCIYSSVVFLIEASSFIANKL